MNAPLDDLIRTALSDMAQEAVPVSLIPRAIDRAHRRRTKKLTLSAAAVVAGLLIGTPLALAAGGKTDPPLTPSPSPFEPVPTASPSPNQPVPTASPGGPTPTASPGEPTPTASPGRPTPTPSPTCAAVTPPRDSCFSPIPTASPYR